MNRILAKTVTISIILPTALVLSPAEGATFHYYCTVSFDDRKGYATPIYTVDSELDDFFLAEALSENGIRYTRAQLHPGIYHWVNCVARQTLIDTRRAFEDNNEGVELRDIPQSILEADLEDALRRPSERMTRADKSGARIKVAEEKEPVTLSSSEVRMQAEDAEPASGANLAALTALERARAEEKKRNADAQAAHQAQLDLAEDARRQYEDGLQLAARQRAEYERKLAEYQQAIRNPKLNRSAIQLSEQDAEQKRRAMLREQELLEQRRREEAERHAPIQFKEGIVLCSKHGSTKQSRCQGPLQTTYGDLEKPEGQVALGQACGSGKSIREIGSVSGYRVFGCGFGIHPSAYDYPGNIDVPAQLGVYVAERAVFTCPRSRLAYCRGN